VERVLGFLGVRAVPIDPISNAVNLAYGRMDEIAERKGSLNQQGINAENSTPEYRKLLDQEKILRQITYSGKQMRGDAVLPTAGGPSKRRVTKSRPKPAANDWSEFAGGSPSSSGTDWSEFADGASSGSSSGGNDWSEFAD
jgi:hypothetical protein